MLKLTAVVSLVLIATWSQADSKRHKKEATASGDFEPVSGLWAAGLSCDSCGSECAAACGTRHFRSCCFNYLRRKRGPDVTKKIWPQTPYETRADPRNPQRPIYLIEDVPEPVLTEILASDLKPAYYPMRDNFENRLQAIYDV